MAGSKQAREEDLARLVDDLWLGPESDSPVLVSSTPPPDSHALVESYAVVTGPTGPRYLVPSGAARAVAAASYRVPRSGRHDGAVRLTVATGIVAASRLSRRRLFVSISRDVPRARRSDHLVLSGLADQLAEPGLLALVSVRRLRPTSKPVLRLFTRKGRSVGFAKVAASPVTRHVVSNEAMVLRELRGRLRHVRVPDVLAFGDLGQKGYLVTSPLPSPLRRWAGPPPDMHRLVLDVASSNEGLRQEPLRDSAFRARITGELHRARVAAPQLVALLARRLDDLCARSEAPLWFGRWHGDWTRWNVVSAAGQPAAWDWEYSEPSAPLGFDLLHWHFQDCLSKPGADLAEAVRALSIATPGLATLGVPTCQRDLVAELFLVETFTRACRLNAAGGGWNPRLYPAALQVAARWGGDQGA